MKKRKRRARQRDYWLEAKKDTARQRYIFDNRNFSILWQKIIDLDNAFNLIKDRDDWDMLNRRLALRIEYGA